MTLRRAASLWKTPFSTHREVGRKLDPLVHFALALRPPDLPAASDATRQHVLSELRQAVEAEEQMDAKPSSLMAIAGDMLLALGGAASRIPESLRLAFGFVFAAVLLLASVHHAAANSLPGDPVYAVKRLEESVTLTLARSPEAKARTYLALAALRLSEAHTLYRTGADNRAKATTVEYSGSIVKGLGYLSAAQGELPVAELREQYGQAFLIYQAATAQSPYLWDDDTRAVLRKAWEGFASGGTDSNSGSRDDDGGDGNAHVWDGDRGQPIGKSEDDDGSTSAQPAARDQGPASSRSEDDKINTGDQPEAAGEGTRPAEKSQRSQPESRLEGVESGDKSHGSQSAADHRGARRTATRRSISRPCHTRRSARPWGGSASLTPTPSLRMHFYS